MKPKLGLYSPGVPWDLDRYVEASGAVGIVPRVAAFYLSWEDRLPLPELRRLLQGAAPHAMVTWEPFTAPLTMITAGGFDRYIDQWAEDVRSLWPHTLAIRFAHEMNGGWYPWAGNGPQYRAAWEYVVDRFRAAAVTNVEWVWCPNVPYPGSKPMEAFWPGDRWVDRVGLDGYNFGDGGQRPSFQDLFAPGVAELDGFARGKPYMVCETACHRDGRRPDWVAEMGEAPILKRFDTVVWFDEDKLEGGKRRDFALDGRAARELGEAFGKDGRRKRRRRT